MEWREKTALLQLILNYNTINTELSCDSTRITRQFSINYKAGMLQGERTYYSAVYLCSTVMLLTPSPSVLSASRGR